MTSKHTAKTYLCLYHYNHNIQHTFKMKKLFIAITVLTSALTAGAQDIFDNPDNHSYFGFRASYELACPGDIKTGNDVLKYDVYGNSSGFSLEAIYNIPVWKNLYFEPGAGIFYNTYSINKNAIGEELEFGDKPLDSASARMWGVRIPLNVGYHFDLTPDISVSVFTGPEIDIAFKGKTHLGIDEYNVSGPLFGKNGDLNRADIKWGFGVGATIFDHYYFALSGAAGLCDMARDVIVTDENNIDVKVPLKMHSNRFNITFGYNF